MRQDVESSFQDAEIPLRRPRGAELKLSKSEGEAEFGQRGAARNAQDVIEDIAIGYGYDYINAMPIASTQPGKLEERTRFNRKLTDIMVGLGFFESANSYLTN